jgi:prevent-host-death family protein
MAEVGILEAKTHLSQLVQRVERGEEIVLTRHGKAVARLAPVRSDEQRSRRGGDIVARMQALAKGSRLDGLTIRELLGRDEA